METMLPALLNTIARELVVPWSSDRMYFPLGIYIGL
jgi:hypothetical protein